MKHVGIDFGTKKCGVAVSDDLGTVAVPLKIVPTTEVMQELEYILQNDKFKKVVVGESVNSKGEHNQVFITTEKFVEKTSAAFPGVEFVYEKEFFTSKHARSQDGKKEVDDRAAALVLQRYLDRHNQKAKNAQTQQEKDLQAEFEEDFEFDN